LRTRLKRTSWKAVRMAAEKMKIRDIQRREEKELLRFIG
jgi:hypothetical protein